ncbi:pyrroline-5-carboxylate reductase [Candidatus Poribacteria bacterium]
MNTEKLGFIGVGNMGEALLRGIIGSGLMSPADIFASDADSKKLSGLSDELGIAAVESNCELVRKASVILFALKPNVIKAVLSEVSPCFSPPKWCISIVTGTSTGVIESILQANVPVVRVMPNTPAMVYEGMAAICPGKYADEEHTQKTQQILQAVGKAIIVQEKLMDAVTALSGSGPAFVYLVIESLTDAGLKLGLSYADAATLAAQTVIGAGRMVVDTEEHPAVLKNKVTSPGGTTAAGLYHLERNGVRAAIIDAVAAAAARAKELSSE